MDKLRLGDVSSFGEDPLPDVKDNVFGFVSKNNTFYSDIKNPGVHSKKGEQRTQFENNIKEFVLSILKDSKSLMFAVQVLKITNSAEAVKEDSKYEVLSITSPSSNSNNADFDRLKIEVLIQKTKYGQVNIHKAIVDISILSVSKLTRTTADLKFETKIKIHNADTQAAITLYFILKAMSLIFGNFGLFSAHLAGDGKEFQCHVLLPRQYQNDENKKKYTLNYIKQAINYLIKSNGLIDNQDEDAKLKSEKKLNDHINRLLMLGVSPSTISLLRKYLLFSGKTEIGEDSIEMITTVNVDENISRSKGTSFLLSL